jgi:hypothetical protein
MYVFFHIFINLKNNKIFLVSYKYQSEHMIPYVRIGASKFVMVCHDVQQLLGASNQTYGKSSALGHRLIDSLFSARQARYISLNQPKIKLQASGDFRESEFNDQIARSPG